MADVRCDFTGAAGMWAGGTCAVDGERLTLTAVAAERSTAVDLQPVPRS
jgi:hypothetical protein